MATIDQIKLEFPAQDGLSGTSWRFYLLRDRLVVDAYQEWSRPSRRHKPAVVRAWDRLSCHRCDMPLADVPLTDAIAAQAKSEWLRMLQERVKVGFQ